MLTCSECRSPVPTARGLTRHLIIAHGYNVMSVFKCGNCDGQYGSVKSFRDHLRRQHFHHRPAPNQVQPDDRPDELENDREDILDRPIDPDNGNQNDNDEGVAALNNVLPVTLADFKSALYNSSLGLATKLYSCKTFNRAQIQEIIDCVNEHASSGFLDVLKEKVMTMLNGNWADNDLNDLNSMFSSMENMFSGLYTERQRLNALKSQYCYVPPEAYFIGIGQKTKRINGQPVITDVELSGQHISMKKVLKQFFQLPGVLQATLQNIASLRNSRKFTNVIQGSLWREIERNLFQGRTVFPLFIYFDDVEPDNQTGAHSGTHKIGAVYYQVPCIPQHLLSCLDNIFCASVFLSDDRNRNNGRAFRPLLNDLRDLQTDGLLIETEAGEHQIFFALCLILGDNLGLHSILGFAESFSANFYCRFCKAHKRVSQMQLREDPLLLRNRANYNEDVQTDDVSVTGIKAASVWHELQTFHVTENLSVDLMHDFLEGVCHYDLCAVLSEFIYIDRFFTLETLNDRIQGFDYGPDGGNKPSIIKADHIRNEKLKMYASEMFFFCRHLGLIIGDLVPEGNEHWKLYVKLLEIMNILMAPSVDRNSVAYLATVISEHHEIYVRVIGKTLKPKHHFMLHYPRILLLLGPVIHIWSMRFEGKHRPVVKQAARQSGNRINFPLSVATRYCLDLSARFFSNTGFPRNFISKSKELQIRECDFYENFQYILPDDHDMLIVVKEATCFSTSYSQEMVLAINFEDDLPLFGKLKWIVKPDDNNKVRFILSGLQTIAFCEHLQCYKVRPSYEWFIVPHDSLVSFHTSYSRIGADGNTYVTFRHFL